MSVMPADAVPPTDGTPITPPQPDIPPLQPPVLAGGPLDQTTTQAAIDAAMKANAASNTADVLGQMNDAIVALQNTTAQNSEQTNRLNAAVRALDCPADQLDPYTKDEIATIGDCLEYGICTCDVGIALQGPPPPPPQNNGTDQPPPQT